MRNGVLAALILALGLAAGGHLFDIQDRDPFSPEFKKVRVATTIQYFLKD